ncbi:MAG: glycosyltransferase [Gammaproteobacteria bacterium]
MSNKPRILYMLHNPFIRCGTELHTKALFEGLKHKYDTWLVYPKGDSLFLTNDGQTAYKYAADPIRRPIMPVSAPLTSQSLQAVFARVQPDLIHIQHFCNWPVDVLDQVTANGRPVVLSLHDYYAITPAFTMMGVDDPGVTLSTDYSSSVFGMDISGFLSQRRGILHESLGRVSEIVVPSGFLAKVMGTIFPYEYKIIPHGIYDYAPVPKNTSRDMFIFGFVGHLIPPKGWETLVQAFPLVKERFPQTELHLFGSPRPENADVQGIVYHGRYDQGDLPNIFSRMDVAIIPSIFAEPFCLVLSEAWMAGCPVAVSDIGALGDRVEDGVNGRKFRAGDVSAIQDALDWFLQHDDWKTWKIEKPKTVEQMWDDYDRLYERKLVLA